MRSYYNANQQDAKMYQKWNGTTATCYYYKMICKHCPNERTCKQMSDKMNRYGIRQVKYATLMTYANIGKKGLERYLDMHNGGFEV